MKFSIIIPAYNEEKFIESAIRSVLANQKFITRKDFEILIVNNNSIDRTKEIAHQAGADKIIFESQKGTNFARQKGFSESQGRIVAFLDADCIAPEDWLLRIEKDLNINNYAAVSGPYDYQLKGIKQILSNFWQKIICPIIPQVLYFIFRKKTGLIINGNWAAKRETLEKVGGIPPAKFEGDDAFIANLISRNVGPVFFDRHLVVKTSSRRFQKEGMVRTAFIYALNYLNVYFKNRPLIINKQRDIR